MSDKERGLYNKYEVKRTNDPEGKHEHCSYFVLDIEHDPFAIPALRAYAAACKQEYPKLANDLEYIDALKCKQPGCCTCPDMERCPECNYTEHDKRHLLDHHICSEKKKKNER